MGFKTLNRLKRRLTRASLDNLKGKKDLIGAEVGVQYGVNAKDILERFNIKALYLIDPYVKYITVKGVIKNSAKVEEVAKAYLKDYENKIIWLKDYAYNAVDKVPMLDFVYIDGDHTYPNVKVDIELYYPKVKSGGLFAGHDYTRHVRHAGVVRAVNEFFANNNETLRTGGGADWWCIKK